MMRRIGFYPRYDRLGASSRYRFFLPLERWRREISHAAGEGNGSGAAEVKLRLHPGLSNRYLRRLYRMRARNTDENRVRGGRDWPSRLAGASLLLRRLAMIPFLEPELVIEYELFPGFSADFELKALAHHRFILNFDDDVWEKYRGIPALQDKFDRLCGAAAGVIVANEFLAGKVRRFNDRVIRIPTVPDLSEYRPAAEEPTPDEPVRVLWIGTPMTYGYLQQALPALQALSKANPRLELLILAAAELKKNAPLSGVRACYRDWTPQAEKDALAEARFGIMPLPDDEAFARGKSAFKLIQYMAAGLPSIVSPVGENRRVLEAGKTGLFARTPDEWAEAGTRLLTDAILCRSMGRNAREKAEREYSLEVQFPRWRDFILASGEGAHGA